MWFATFFGEVPISRLTAMFFLGREGLERNHPLPTRKSLPRRSWHSIEMILVFMCRQFIYYYYTACWNRTLLLMHVIYYTPPLIPNEGSLVLATENCMAMANANPVFETKMIHFDLHSSSTKKLIFCTCRLPPVRSARWGTEPWILSRPIWQNEEHGGSDQGASLGGEKWLCFSEGFSSQRVLLGDPNRTSSIFAHRQSKAINVVWIPNMI